MKNVFLHAHVIYKPDYACMEIKLPETAKLLKKKFVR